MKEEFKKALNYIISKAPGLGDAAKLYIEKFVTKCSVNPRVKRELDRNFRRSEIFQNSIFSNVKKWENENRKRASVHKFMYVRFLLKYLKKDGNLAPKDRMELTYLMSSLPRSSALTRVRNRDIITGETHSYSRKLSLSRHSIRLLFNRGEIPCLIKGSW